MPGQRRMDGNGIIPKVLVVEAIVEPYTMIMSVSRPAERILKVEKLAFS